MPTVCVCVCVRACVCIFFPLVLLDWLAFTLKVADHLRQMAWSNRLNVKQPASTSSAQNVDSVNETLYWHIIPTSNDWWFLKRKKAKITHPTNNLLPSAPFKKKKKTLCIHSFKVDNKPFGNGG